MRGHGPSPYLRSTRPASCSPFSPVLALSSPCTEFTYPASWLGDQTLAYRAAKRAEAARGGPPTFGSRRDDFDDSGFPALSPPRRPAPQQARGAEVAEPVVAFGPPGTT